MYLLPAGESTFLGAIKSMVVEPYPPTQLLSQRLSTRYIPLQDEKILIIIGKSKNAEAKVLPPWPPTKLTELEKLPFHYPYARSKGSVSMSDVGGSRCLFVSGRVYACNCRGGRSAEVWDGTC